MQLLSPASSMSASQIVHFLQRLLRCSFTQFLLKCIYYTSETCAPLRLHFQSLLEPVMGTQRSVSHVRYAIEMPIQGFPVCHQRTVIVAAVEPVSRCPSCDATRDSSGAYFAMGVSLRR